MNIIHRFLGGVAAAAAQIGSLVTTGIDTVSIANGLTASTTHTIAGGTPVTAAISIFSTVANVGDAATLPAMQPGQSVDIYNAGAAAMAVYPSGASVKIDGGTAGASVTLTNGKRCRFTCIAANSIVSAQLGAVSA